MKKHWYWSVAIAGIFAASVASAQALSPGSAKEVVAQLSTGACFMPTNWRCTAYGAINSE